MITACKHKQPLSHSNHGTIGENPDHPYPTHQALKSRFGYYSTSKGAGLANELDNDNGMLNKRPRPFTFLHQVTSHRHGTWGEAYAKSLNDRFGYYTTSKGIGFSGAMDYDNGMLNKRPRFHSSNHGTIGEVYDLNDPAYRALNSRFGWYSTSKGVGFFGVEYDYDNGMLNTTSDDVPLTLTCPY